MKRVIQPLMALLCLFASFYSAHAQDNTEDEWYDGTLEVISPVDVRIEEKLIVIGASRLNDSVRVNGVMSIRENLGVGTIPATRFHVRDGLILFNHQGTTPITYPPEATGPGARFLYSTQYGIFRAGGVSGMEWDSINNGLFSSAFGEDNIARGRSSTAVGVANTVDGIASFSGGVANTVLGEHSASFGEDNYNNSTNTMTGGNLNRTNISESTFMWGFHNRDSSSNNTIIAGRDNISIDGDNSILSGADNINLGSLTLLTGYDNENTGIGNIVTGTLVINFTFRVNKID